MKNDVPSDLYMKTETRIIKENDLSLVLSPLTYYPFVVSDRWCGTMGRESVSNGFRLSSQTHPVVGRSSDRLVEGRSRGLPYDTSDREMLTYHVVTFGRVTLNLLILLFSFRSLTKIDVNVYDNKR